MKESRSGGGKNSTSLSAAILKERQNSMIKLQKFCSKQRRATV